MKLSSLEQAESFVFVQEAPLRLRYQPLPGAALRVFQKGVPAGTEEVVYEEGADYIYDSAAATLRRTPGSRIPDWANHPFYGLSERFDHSLYAEYSNRPYTVYVEYPHERMGTAASEPELAEGLSKWLPHLASKLRAGEQAHYAVIGDSISAGGEASEPRLAYYQRFADYLAALVPGSNLQLTNQAIGGEASGGGAERIERDIVALQPDLVTIGYGMNDQNQYEHGPGTTLADFEQNLRTMIEAIKGNTAAGLVLVTPCEPNPDWLYTSGKTGEYADVIRKLGAEYEVGVADVHALWQEELAAGKTHGSLLLNHINHPNDYGHYVYFQAFERMLAP